jgi:hypothetical protein
MKKVVLVIALMTLMGCQGFVDDQGGINGKIEDFVKEKLYPKNTVESVDFSRFLKGTDKKTNYYWLDYTFFVKMNGQKKLLKYHFETDSLLNIITYKNTSSTLKNSLY